MRRLAWLAYLLPLALGGVGWLASAPVITTPAYAVEHAATPEEAGTVNLAALSRGARVTVSSYHWFNSHHPLFLIDEHPNPGLTEKWVSAGKDRAPWLELALAAPARVESIALDLASIREDRAYDLRDYDLTCLGPEGVLSRFEVRGNTGSRPVHALGCEGATRIRIDFQVEEEGSPRGVVRLFELRVLGRFEAGGEGA
ncbi:MAG: hypothetical protein P1V51_14855 [Deltaproteobacteria bacterium]|nr:hypothetical protein [Deltaproteobacteria bacterium]